MNYNINFQENIMQEQFNSRVEGILNWIKENREKEEWAKDPNTFELTNVFLFAGKYAQERQKVDKDSLRQMWEIRSQDFERCGVSNESFIYRICEDSYLSAMEGRALVNDENSHHALRRMAGIGLYLKQQQRNIQKQNSERQVDYNNPQELLELMECAKTLKTFHPDLFEKYRFEQNIDDIMLVQTQHEMSKEMEDKLRQAQEQIHQKSGIQEKGQTVNRLEEKSL